MLLLQSLILINYRIIYLSVLNFFDISWCIMGDFDYILNSYDKLLIENCILIYLGFFGSTYNTHSYGLTVMVTHLFTICLTYAPQIIKLI